MLIQWGTLLVSLVYACSPTLLNRIFPFFTDSRTLVCLIPRCFATSVALWPVSSTAICATIARASEILGFLLPEQISSGDTPKASDTSFIRSSIAFLCKRNGARWYVCYFIWHGLRGLRGFLAFVLVVALKFRHLNC